MKKKTLLVLVLAFAMIFTLTACGSSDTAPADNASALSGQTFNVGTGGNTGTYYAYGTAIGQVIGDACGATFTIQSTGASKANIQLIDSGDIQLALVQNDVMDYAYNGTDLFSEDGAVTSFGAIATLYPEVVQIVVNDDSDIESVADLAGKNVSVGDAGSGVEFNATQILAAYDMTFEDISKQNLSFGDSADALKDGKIDAFFCVAGAPTTAIMDLATTNDIDLLTIDEEHAAALIEKYPFYTEYTIDAGSYNGVDEDAVTLAIKATLIGSSELSEDVVYELTKAIFENKEDITVAHEKGSYLDTEYAVEGVSIPFLPGAEKYFKEAGVM